MFRAGRVSFDEFGGPGVDIAELILPGQAVGESAWLTVGCHKRDLSHRTVPCGAHLKRMARDHHGFRSPEIGR